MESVGHLKNLKSNRDAAVQLAEILQELGRRIQEVALLLHPSPAHSIGQPQGKSLLDLINDVLLSKAAKGVRDRTLGQLRSSLVFFGEGRLNRPINSITPEEIEAISLERDWSPATRRSFLVDVRTAFNFGVRRGYLARSPAGAVDLPLLDDKSVALHSPAEVQQLLHTAQAHDKDVMRFLAILYFAGLRPEAEGWRLKEKHILPGLVDVTFSKIRRTRRLIKIEPALQAFLDVGGTLPVVNLVKRVRRVRELAGVQWKQDVTRHSFATYHLAFHGDPKKTMKEMGHRSTDLLFSTYRELRTRDGQLVTEALAEKFWAIRPM